MKYLMVFFFCLSKILSPSIKSELSEENLPEALFLISEVTYRKRAYLRERR